MIEREVKWEDVPLLTRYVDFSNQFNVYETKVARTVRRLNLQWDKWTMTLQNGVPRSLTGPNGRHFKCLKDPTSNWDHYPDKPWQELTKLLKYKHGVEEDEYRNDPLFADHPDCIKRALLSDLLEHGRIVPPKRTLFSGPAEKFTLFGEGICTWSWPFDQPFIRAWLMDDQGSPSDRLHRVIELLKKKKLHLDEWSETFYCSGPKLNEVIAVHHVWYNDGEMQTDTYSANEKWKSFAHPKEVKEPHRWHQVEYYPTLTQAVAALDEGDLKNLCNWYFLKTDWPEGFTMSYLETLLGITSSHYEEALKTALDGLDEEDQVCAEQALMQDLARRVVLCQYHLTLDKEDPVEIYNRYAIPHTLRKHATADGKVYLLTTLNANRKERDEVFDFSEKGLDKQYTIFGQEGGNSWK